MKRAIHHRRCVSGRLEAGGEKMHKFPRDRIISPKKSNGIADIRSIVCLSASFIFIAKTRINHVLSGGKGEPVLDRFARRKLGFLNYALMDSFMFSNRTALYETAY